jgi:hypothetical protein
MDNLDKSSYTLHSNFNSAHKTVRQYNWIVNEIKEESHPVAFDSIVSKVQSAFAIKPDNPEIPTREQILEGIQMLLADELIVQA